MPPASLYLVAIDGAEASVRAAKLAAQEAALHGAVLVILHVIEWSGFEILPVPDLVERHKGREQEKTAAMDLVVLPLLRRIEDHRLTPRVRVEFGDPADTILEVAAAEKAGRIFIGRHSRSKLNELVFGSVSHDVARRAAAPVTVVP